MCKFNYKKINYKINYKIVVLIIILINYDSYSVENQSTLINTTEQVKLYDSKPYTAPYYNISETIDIIDQNKLDKYNFTTNDNCIYINNKIKYIDAMNLLNIKSTKYFQTAPSSYSFYIICRDGSFVVLDIHKVSYDTEKKEYLIDNDQEIEMVVNRTKRYKDRIIE